MATTFEDIKKYMVDNDMYDITDDILINELIEAINLREKASQSIEDEGLIVMAGDYADGMLRPNPAASLLVSLSKNVQAITKRLGLEFRSRVELGLVKKDDDDGFDN